MQKQLWMTALCLLLAACNLSAETPPDVSLPEATPVESGGPAPAAATPAPETAACVVLRDWPVYIVQPGDTMDSLAARARVTVGVLADANCIDNPDLIVAGQALHVPYELPPAVEGELAFSRRTPEDDGCYLMTFGIGEPFEVYASPDRHTGEDHLNIFVPGSVFLPVLARSEHRAQVTLPDGRLVWIESLVGLFMGDCSSTPRG